MVVQPGGGGEGGDRCPLRAIFYADFDNETGRKLVHQYPSNVFTKEHQQIFSTRIIANAEFCDKVTVLDSMAFPWTLATFPAEIASDKYDRGILRYNVSFVFAKGTFGTEPYQMVLQKLGRWLRVMELRFGYLYGPGSKSRLQQVLERVYKGINAHGEAAIEMRGCGAPRLLLVLRPYAPRTPLKNWRKIQDHEVPVRRCAGLPEGVDDVGTPVPGAQAEAAFDLALTQVMPHINGVKHVKKISIDSQVDIDVVKGAVQWALYTNQILLTDVFRYSNVYVQTTLTREYTQRPDFRMACWERIAKTLPPSTAASTPAAGSAAAAAGPARETTTTPAAAAAAAAATTAARSTAPTSTATGTTPATSTAATSTSATSTAATAAMATAAATTASATTATATAVAATAAAKGAGGDIGSKRSGVGDVGNDNVATGGFPRERDGGSGSGSGVGVGGGGGSREAGGRIPPAPHPMCLVRLYASFQSDRTVKDVLREAEGVEGFAEEIDHRSMCSFGVEVGILRRLHCYPICVKREHQKDSPSLPSQKPPTPRARRFPSDSQAGTPTSQQQHRGSLYDRYDLDSVQRLVDGQRTEDAVCCYLGGSPRELERFLTSDGSKLYRPHLH